MALSAGGIGSGLDVNGIVSQLMALERRPLDKLASQKSDLNAQLSAYGQLKSAVSTFQNAMAGLSTSDKFQVFSATSSNDTSFTATADETASVANYSIDVQALAKAHKFSSGSTAGSTYADENTSIGTTGTLEIAQGATSFQITIDSTNDTLAGIRDTINASVDNTGVTASIVNTGTEAKLVLTANDTGTANTISLGAGTTASVSTALGFETIAGNEAADAVVNIDGIAVTSASNTISTAIQGVTLELKQADAGVIQSLDIARDTDTVKSAVKTFVDGYNDLQRVLNVLGGEGGTLEGDSGLLSIERRMQGIFNTPNSASALGYLSEAGITTTSTGSLELDDTTLTDVIDSGFSSLATLFSDANEGFAVRFEAVADDIAAYNGLIESRKTGIDARIESVTSREESMAYRLDIVEKRYQRQFSALDSLIAQMNSTGNYLTQQLASLPGVTNRA